MAATGFYHTLRRPRTHRPLSMLKYDPVGESGISYFAFDALGLGVVWDCGGLGEGAETAINLERQEDKRRDERQLKRLSDPHIPTRNLFPETDHKHLARQSPKRVWNEKESGPLCSPKKREEERKKN